MEPSGDDENLPLENSWCFWFDKGQKERTGGVSSKARREEEKKNERKGKRGLQQQKLRLIIMYTIGSDSVLGSAEEHWRLFNCGGFLEEFQPSTCRGHAARSESDAVQIRS